MTNNKRLSIIIPHYNSLDTLKILLDSIPANDNIEIVIVDDLSDIGYEAVKNAIFEMTDVIAGKDITVISNETGVFGPGGARNQGMEAAKGEWFLFADSDDSFVGDFYSIVSEYFESDADIVYFCPNGINADTGKPSNRHMRYVDVVLKCANNHSIANETEMKYSFCTPWSKLFRASIIRENNLKYADTKASEDVYFVTQVAYNARKVIADKRVIYCVTRRSGTLTSHKTEEDFDSNIDIMIWRYNYLKDNLKESFKYTKMEYLALAKVVDAMLNGFGIKKALQIIRRYNKSGVRFISLSMLSPSMVLRSIEIEMKHWSEIKKK